MSKAFSVVSWNVKHFKKKEGDPVDQTRVNKVTSYLKQQDPDVFGIYEVVGKDVFTEMMNQFPGYTFHITEGRQTQEILVGVRNTLGVFFTQKTEFQSGVQWMRPGLLATINVDDVNYSLLFLHLASLTEPRGMGLRDDMLRRAMKFRHTLDDAYGGHHTANYIFLGDLNTMGMEYPFENDIVAEHEIQKWDEAAKNTYGMRRLSKTMEETWSSLSTSKLGRSNLDHVYAAEHLNFKKFTNQDDVQVEIDMRGWVNENTDAEKDTWIKTYSDHSLMYFELEKISP